MDEFQQAKKELVVIEEDEEVIDYLTEQYPNLLVLSGDATKDEVLEEANIKQASALITALSEDTANLFVVISARSLNPDLKVIARAVDPHTAGKMYKAGATHVVSPNLTEGIRMAAVVLRPNVVNFLDVVTPRSGDCPAAGGGHSAARVGVSQKEPARAGNSTTHWPDRDRHHQAG
ncbi:MAG: NAD-binding protein [candidate division KSB1 bacterium]|nr:NAD-binding protein [candidate division KSB1 bacterium]